MTYLTYLDYIPSLPKEFENLAYSAISTEDLQEKLAGERSRFFQCYQLPSEIINWCKAHINLPNNLVDTDFKVHVLWHDIKIHSDYGRSRAINYVLDAGGDNASTAWYDDKKIEKIYEDVIPLRKWHTLDTKTYHTVHGIAENRKRIGITITTEKVIPTSPINLY